MQLRCYLLALILAVVSASYVAAESVFDMSLEELMAIEITSAAKKPQMIEDIPAAVYVISAEQIHTSGAASVQEALRLAPGLQSLAIHNGRWSVSIRGAAREYVNKLLVLVDGRSVYSPTFSGTLWENFDIPLENIARIEVIRGPGAAVWGSNAVNGVINIVTKSAAETLGGILTLAAGNKLKSSAFYRYGFRHSDHTSVRIHAKGFEFGQSRQTDKSPGEDAWRNRSAGFRIDRSTHDDKQTFMMQGNLFAAKADDELIQYGRPPAVNNILHTQQTAGFNLSARWETFHSDSRSESFQLSFDRISIDSSLIKENRSTVELEFSERINRFRRHDVVWGIGARLTHDSIGDGSSMRLDKQSHDHAQLRLFVNDDISLAEKLNLSLGAGLDHDKFTGLEFQPSARLHFKPDGLNSIWLAASRASRIPSRIERGARYYFLADTSPPQPFVADTIFADLSSEKLTSYELGWRTELKKNLSFDLAGYYFKYKSGVGAQNVATAIDPAGYLFVERSLNNDVKGDFRGFELSVDWKAADRWAVSGMYSYIDVITNVAPGNLALDIDKNVPAKMYSIFSRFDIDAKTSWSLWFRHVGRIDSSNLAGYQTVDSTIVWSPALNLKIRLVGQNIFDKTHQQFAPRFVFSHPREFGRRYYLETEWSF